VFRKTGDSGKCLATFAAFDLHPAICMHTFVSAEVGKLRVTLVTYFTAEGFNTAVNVGMLF